MKTEIKQGLVFGLSIGDLLTIYDRDSQSWKMSECLFTGDYAKYLEALPRSGMMRNGRIYAQATWAPRTGGKESGLWPTPQQSGGEWSGCMEWKDRFRGNPLMNAVKLTEKFPTPHSNCHTGADQTAVMWPTPQSRDWKGKSQRGAYPENRDCLPNAVMNYPTPRGGAGGVGLCGGKGSRDMLLDMEDAGMITEPERKSMQAGNGGQLNPTWVDWLMGYPVGWTDLKDSEIQLSLK